MGLLSTPKDVRSWWMLMIVLLAALVLVQYVGADSWVKTTLLPGPNNGVYFNGQYDSSGNLHFVFVDDSTNEYYYGFKNSTGIYTTLLATTTTIGDIDLFVESSGDIHIAFHSKSSDVMYYVTKAYGGSWSAIETAGSTESIDFYDKTKIVVTSGGIPYILSSQCYTTSNATVFYKDGSWEADTLMNVDLFPAVFADMNINASDCVGVLYSPDGTHTTISFDDGSHAWTTENIESSEYLLWEVE